MPKFLVLRSVFLILLMIRYGSIVQNFQGYWIKLPEKEGGNGSRNVGSHAVRPPDVTARARQPYCALCTSFFLLHGALTSTELTYLHTPRSKVLLENLTGLQPVKKFPIFYGTRRIITEFTSARQLSLYWASSFQSILTHTNSGRSILILSSHPSPWPLQKSLSIRFPHQNSIHLSPIRATCLAHFILLDFITRKILSEQYRAISYSLCSFLHSLLPHPS